jgi:hypothetical protein
MLDLRLRRRHDRSHDSTRRDDLHRADIRRRLRELDPFDGFDSRIFGRHLDRPSRSDRLHLVDGLATGGSKSAQRGENTGRELHGDGSRNARGPWKLSCVFACNVAGMDEPRNVEPDDHDRRYAHCVE